MTFTCIGNTGLLAPIATELEALGAKLDAVAPMLVLVGASTLDEAAAELRTLPHELVAKTVVVGIDGSLEMQLRPKPGTFAAFLEDSRILGSMPSELAADWGDFGFAGRKDLADRMGLWHAKAAQSPRYAVWAGLKDFSGAGAFLVRLASVST